MVYIILPIIEEGGYDENVCDWMPGRSAISHMSMAALLDSTDLVYMGAFRMPSTLSNGNDARGGTALAHRYVGNELRFFSTDFWRDETPLLPSSLRFPIRVFQQTARAIQTLRSLRNGATLSGQAHNGHGLRHLLGRGRQTHLLELWQQLQCNK